MTLHEILRACYEQQGKAFVTNLPDVEIQADADGGYNVNVAALLAAFDAVTYYDSETNTVVIVSPNGPLIFWPARAKREGGAMTTTKPDELTGRELDAEVHRMLFADCEHVAVKDPDGLPLGLYRCSLCANVFSDYPPMVHGTAPYSADIAAAWLVVESAEVACQLSFALFHHATVSSAGNGWTAVFAASVFVPSLTDLRHGDPKRIFGWRAETAPEAICRAVLIALRGVAALREATA